MQPKDFETMSKQVRDMAEVLYDRFERTTLRNILNKKEAPSVWRNVTSRLSPKEAEQATELAFAWTAEDSMAGAIFPESKKEESEMIEITEDMKILGTNIILEEGDRIRILSEALTTADELAKEIENTFKKYFSNSYVDSSFDRHLSSDITVRIALAKDRNEAINKIMENDPMKAIFFIDLDRKVDSEGKIIQPLMVERISGGGLFWFPVGERNMKRIKVPFRKTTSDPTKIVKVFETHFKELQKAVKDNAESLNKVLLFDVLKKIK